VPASDYTAAYLAEVRELAARIDPTIVNRMIELLLEIRAQGGRIFFLGVGGGAGHASHAVNDFRKIAWIECYAPTDNVSELTARINDDGWDSCYANWLRVSHLGQRDAVFVFSVGGGNPEHRIAKPARVSSASSAAMAATPRNSPTPASSSPRSLLKPSPRIPRSSKRSSGTCSSPIPCCARMR